jgi:hypothetical protein
MGLESIAFKDFSGGWQPNSDPVNGPKNGFLTFDHLDLEATGAAKGSGNIISLWSGSGNIHTGYYRTLSGANYIYTGLSNSTVTENNVLILSGGNNSRCAFSSAFGYVFMCSGSQYKKTVGGGAGVVKNLGLATAASAPTIGATAGGNLNGAYQWMQVYVSENVQGYTTFGQASPITALTTLANLNQALTLLDPTIPEPNATHVYLYRRGGNLDQFYYVGKVAAGTTAYTDNLSDSDVLAQQTLSNQYNLFYTTVNDTNVSSPDGPVYEMVGLVYGRMLYFTAKNIYISKINCPDVFDSRTTIGFGGSNSEIFLFARKLGNNTIVVGTTLDLYLITGTFQEISPGVLDVTISPLGVPSPPIVRCAAIWNHHLVYVSATGWILYSPTLGYLQGENNICAGITDRLYYSASNINGFPTTILSVSAAGTDNTFSCAVYQNKLYVINYLAPSHRVEVYDFIRKYWKTYSGISNTISTTNSILFTGGGLYLGSGVVLYTFGGVGNAASSDNFANNAVDLKTCFSDGGKPNVRKDPLTLRIKANTSNQTATVKISLDGSGSQTNLGAFSCNGVQDNFFDLGPNGANIATFKNIQVEITVQGSNLAFILEDIEIYYSPRVEQLNYYQDLRIPFPPELIGKRVRVRAWPIVIDTLNQTVSVRPLINGTTSSSAPAQNITGINGRQTVFYQFTNDIPNLIDLGIRIESQSASNVFELYEVGMPDIVQVFPIQRQFDQLGPFDGFRYTKIKAVRVRMFTDYSGNVAYTIYFQDSSSTSGNIAVAANVEDSYEFPVPLTTAGRILRIELNSPGVGSNFYRYYAQVLCVKTGRDTEQEWITLPEAQNA